MPSQVCVPISDIATFYRNNCQNGTNHCNALIAAHTDHIHKRGRLSEAKTSTISKPPRQILKLLCLLIHNPTPRFPNFQQRLQPAEQPLRLLLPKPRNNHPNHFDHLLIHHPRPNLRIRQTNPNLHQPRQKLQKPLIKIQQTPIPPSIKMETNTSYTPRCVVDKSFRKKSSMSGSWGG